MMGGVVERLSSNHGVSFALETADRAGQSYLAAVINDKHSPGTDNIRKSRMEVRVLRPDNKGAVDLVPPSATLLSGLWAVSTAGQGFGFYTVEPAAYFLPTGAHQARAPPSPAAI